MLRKIVNVVVIGLMFSGVYAQTSAADKQLCYQSNISYPQVKVGNAVVAKFVSSFQALLIQVLVDSGDDGLLITSTILPFFIILSFIYNTSLIVIFFFILKNLFKNLS